MKIEFLRKQVEQVANHFEFSDINDCLQMVINIVKSKIPLTSGELEQYSDVASEMIENFVNIKTSENV